MVCLDFAEVKKKKKKISKFYPQWNATPCQNNYFLWCKNGKIGMERNRDPKNENVASSLNCKSYFIIWTFFSFFFPFIWKWILFLWQISSFYGNMIRMLPQGIILIVFNMRRTSSNNSNFICIRIRCNKEKRFRWMAKM